MRATVLAALLLLSAPGDDFAFIHCSDTHAPIAASADAIAEIKAVGELEIPGGTSKAPSFVVVTGDLTEFGVADGWAKYEEWWKGSKAPVYSVMGNHDGTWDCARRELRRLHGAPFYSWDHGGCHFMVLDSASPQDPRPSFGEEVVAWMRRDLAKVGKDTPLFLFFHHPPDGSEFASGYDRQRVLDLARPWPVAGLFVGHYHTAWHRTVDGFDVVGGGATFPKGSSDVGFNLVEVKGRSLRVWWRARGRKEPRLILDKAIERPKPPPALTARVEGGRLHLETDAKEAKADIDDAGPGVDVRDGRAELPLAGVPPGIHVARVHGRGWARYAAFSVDGAPKIAWRARLPGAVRGLRAVQDLVLASCGDGTLAALRAADGAVAWSAGSGGEVIGRAAPFRDMIVFGSGDGTVRAVGLDGRPKWTVEAGAPVYASPLALDDRVIVGTTAGTLCALDAAGRVLWKARVAGYAIESSFACDGERVFLGAWDEHVHAVSVKDGSVAWKQKGDGSAGAKAAKRYYSPADCGPALASGRLFVADRAYRLTRLDAATGAVEGAAGEISAVGPTEDGKGFLVRRTTDGVARLNPDGSVAWSVAADTDAVPAAPVERRGVVYVCSSTGLLTGLAAGKVLWRAQVAPMAYVLASPEPGDKHVFVGCQDGGVTAVELP